MLKIPPVPRRLKMIIWITTKKCCPDKVCTDYPLPPSPLKNNNADLSPGIQCCIPPMRKQKAKATAGMKPLEEGYDSTPHNQKCCKVDSVNDSGTIHMFKFITVLHLALPVTENLQASTSARPNTQRQS